MHIVLIILLIVAAIIVILLVAALLLKNEYVIEREIIINKPSSVVYDYIKYLKNSENFNKWVMTDPIMKKGYSGIDGELGFIYTWDSKNKGVGKGEQEIVKLVEGISVDHEIRFVKPFEGTSMSYIKTESISPDQTKVKWIFKGLRNYMLKCMHLIFNLEKVLGKDLQTSLNNLKINLEKKLINKIK